MARTAMTPEERRTILNGAHEPKINPLDYTGSLAHALNYYNVEADSKKKRKYAESYAKKVLGLDVSSASDFLLNTIGAMCRLIDRGEPITEFDIAKTHDGLTKIAQGKVKITSSVTEKIIDTTVPVRPKKSPEQVAEEVANKVIEDIEVAIDTLVCKDGPGGSDYNLKAIVLENSRAAKLCTDHFEYRLKQFEEGRDSDDKDIKEAYSHINRRKMSHIVQFLTDVIEKCKQSVAVAKVNKPKKIRVKKEKPARMIVAKLLYLKKSDEFNIESINPESIVGAREVVLYNTVKRKLTIVRSLDESTLSVRGTTIVNFDPTKTVTKSIRKPQDIIPSFYKVTKQNAKTQFATITTKEGQGTGRCNEDVLILSVNK